MRSKASLFMALSRLAAAFTVQPQSYVIPTGQINGTTDSDLVYRDVAFDGPHIDVNNGSAYQWWYFDALSSENGAAVVAQFYPGWFAESSAVLFTIVWPNGTTYENTIPVGNLQLSTIGDGSQGYVDDGAMTWFGASDLSAYHLTLNLPSIGVSGKITMLSKAPAHVACGVKKAGASFEFAPFLQWANHLPDSDATIDLVVNGTQLSFKGSGYHDQNWGTAPFAAALNQWYWGHANLGDYSLVFFYHMDEDLKVTSSAYLSETGKVIVSSCSSVKVTPQGPGTSVPLKGGTEVEGWTIEINDRNGKYHFTVVNNVMASPGAVVYNRFIGTITGGKVGGANVTGPTVVEWMNNPELVV